ncbi:MAG: TasA family protein [Candidatus Moraniibacteriota bacterium]
MKKILLSLVAIVAVAAIAGGATYSYFTSTVTSPDNTFAAGTMILEINDQNPTATAVFNETNLFPGSVIPQRIFQVENAGTIDAHHVNITVALDADTDLADEIKFYPTGAGNGLRFGASIAGTDSENLVEEILAPAAGNDYLVTDMNGAPFVGADTDLDGTLSLSELAALGTLKVRIAADGNSEGLTHGTSAYLFMNSYVDTDLVTQGETVNATFTFELQQDASQN